MAVREHLGGVNKVIVYDFQSINLSMLVLLYVGSTNFSNPISDSDKEGMIRTWSPQNKKNAKSFERWVLVALTCQICRSHPISTKDLEGVPVSITSS